MAVKINGKPARQHLREKREHGTDLHPEDYALGKDFARLRFDARTGTERDEGRQEVEHGRKERAEIRQKRQQEREEAEAKKERRQRIKRKAYERHGKVLSDAEADRVAAEGWDGDPQEGESEQERFERRTSEHLRRKHLPPRLL